MSTDDYMERYMENDMKRLSALVDKILFKYRSSCEALGISQMDYDDLYSDAAMTLWDVCKRYDGEGTFEALLYKALENKVLSYFTSRGRDKAMPKQRDSQGRKVRNEDGNYIFLTNVSLNAPMDTTDTEEMLIDLLQSDYDLENDVVGDSEYSSKMQTYLKRLPKAARRILELIADGFKPCEIQAEMHITQREYTDGLKTIHAYENISILL